MIDSLVIIATCDLEMIDSLVIIASCDLEFGSLSKLNN